MTSLFWGTLAFGPLLAVLLRYLAGRTVLDNSMLWLGLGLYVFMPFFAYASGSFVDGPGEAIWSREFEALYASGAAFLAVTFCLMAAFGIGQLPRTPPLGRSLNVPLSRASLRRLLIALLFLWTLFAYRARGEFGLGYLVEPSPGLMGPLATVNLVLLLGLLNLKQWRQSKLLELWYSGLLLVNSVLLLSLGGRMYVVTPFVALFLQYINTRRRKPIERAKLLVVVASVLGMLMLVGLWRLDSAVELRLLLLTALAESLLTSISLASYVSCGQIEVLAAPLNFLGSIINFVPSILLPDKTELIPDLDPTSNCIVSPFGATHIGPALLVNFGFVGTACFLAVFAFLLKASRTVQPRGWWFHYYICGLLPLMFFRDGFIVFNKALIGSGLLTAVALVALDRLHIVRLFKTLPQASASVHQP